MIRVLQVNSNIASNSGVMTVLMNYYRNLDHKLIQYDFLYYISPGYGFESYEEEILSYGGRVFFVDNIKNVFLFRKQLLSILEQNHYDFVQIHDPFIVGFINDIIHRSGSKIIVHSHATKWSDKKLSSIRNKILCTGLNSKVDYRFACSLAAGEFLYKNNEFFLFNNAINIERYRFAPIIRDTLRKELKIDDRCVIGHVGNFNKQKNHRFLIDVFSELTNSRSDCVLLLIGDGPLRAETEKYVDDLKIRDRVFFLGKKNNVEKYYQVMDCMMLPSLYEGLPMVGVEAQCSGCPVLFSDTITKEVCASFSGFLSLEDPKTEWVYETLRLAMQKYDRSKCAEEISKMGFDIKTEAKRITEKYYSMKGK